MAVNRKLVTKYFRILLRALFVTYSINAMYMAIDVVYREMRELLMSKTEVDAAAYNELADIIDSDGETVPDPLGLQKSKAGYHSFHDTWNGDSTAFRGKIAEFLRQKMITRQVDSQLDSVQLPRYEDREMTENPGGGMNDLWGITRSVTPFAGIHYGSHGGAEHLLKLRQHLKQNKTCAEFEMEEQEMPFFINFEGQTCPIKFPTLLTMHRQSVAVDSYCLLPWSQEGGLIQKGQTKATKKVIGENTESLRLNLVDQNILREIKTRHLETYKTACHIVVDPSKEIVQGAWGGSFFENPVGAFDAWRKDTAYPLDIGAYVCDYGKYKSPGTMYRFAASDSGIVALKYTYEAEYTLRLVFQPSAFSEEFMKQYPREDMVDYFDFEEDYSLALINHDIYPHPTEITLTNQRQFVLIPQVANYDYTMKIFAGVMFLVSSYVGIYADSLFLLLYIMTESALGFLLLNAGGFFMWGANSKFYAIILTLFGDRSKGGAILLNFWPLGDFKKMNVIFLIVMLKATCAMVLSTFRGIKQAGVFDSLDEKTSDRLGSVPGLKGVMERTKSNSKVRGASTASEQELDSINTGLPSFLNIQSSVLVAASFLLTLSGVTLQPLLHSCITPDECLTETGTVVFVDAILYLFVIVLINFTFSDNEEIKVSNCMMVHKQRIWYYPVIPEMIGVSTAALTAKIAHTNLVAMSESAIQLSMWFNFIFRSVPSNDIKREQSDRGVVVFEIVDGCTSRSTIPSSMVKMPEHIKGRTHWAFVAPPLEGLRKYA